ncbi:Hypothetical predicted protein [Mytilus galloprovincialis]|uniref:Peptidase aspartic putative domain-containing protein n=1 Tax=Mytilus galloprovincialis TaxID=29158 RepID=A0A8B6BNU8_MYTGA|nr:Hypothetical predicted protein [Mytilus galloprovincialis]
MAEKQELERARREIEMKEQMLERKSQLEEAKLEEESVWQEEEEEDTEVTFKNYQNINVPLNTENKTLNNNEHVTTKSTENAVSRIECTTAGSLQSNSSIDTAFQRLASTLQEGFNLPKPELLTFDGKPTDYCKFIKNFETNVECRVTDDQLKLSYLIQYCKGEAKSSIEDCVLLEKKGYERASNSTASRHEGQEVDLHVQSVGSNCPITLSKVWSVKNLPISTHSAANNKDIKSIKHLSDIYIPEISSNKVLLLIGTDTPEAHIPIEVRSGSSHEPYAVRTRLGWIVRGPINNTSTSDVVNINFEHADNVLLQQQLERLWTTDFLDQPSTEKVCMSLEDKRALKTMESTIAYEDGHYKLGLPWRDENVKLPNNLPLAHARLNQLHRKLSHDPKLHEMYTATVSDYIQKRICKGSY